MALAPGLDRAKIALAWTHLRQRNVESARKAATAVLATDPDATAAHLLQAEIGLYFESDFATALVETSAALALEPNHPEALLLHAMVLSAMGRHEEALRAAHGAVESDLSGPVYYIGLARVAIHANDFGAAIEATAHVMADARARRAARRSTLALASAAGGAGTAGIRPTVLRSNEPTTNSMHTDHAGGEGRPGDRTAGDAVAIMNAWIREAHPDATTQAGYMTLVNVSGEERALVELESPSFGKVELHEMNMADGMMKMRELSELVVPAGGQARLEPGGAHLMLWEPKRHLSKGETIALTLTFRSGRQQTLTVSVDDR